MVFYCSMKFSTEWKVKRELNFVSLVNNQSKQTLNWCFCLLPPAQHKKVSSLNFQKLSLVRKYLRVTKIHGWYKIFRPCSLLWLLQALAMLEVSASDWTEQLINMSPPHIEWQVQNWIQTIFHKKKVAVVSY